MIPQAFRRWLHRVFGWFSGRKPVEAEYAHVVTPLNKGMTQEPASRTSSDVIMPQPGIAPRTSGQGDVSCSTIDEWPERVVRPTPTPNEKLETSPLPPTPSTPAPITPSTEFTTTVKEQPSGKNEAVFPDAPPPTPTLEQQLEFLQYLVKRGIVNEGFPEGQTPDQYKKM
jgi:hypothetical protein